MDELNGAEARAQAQAQTQAQAQAQAIYMQTGDFTRAHEPFAAKERPVLDEN